MKYRICFSAKCQRVKGYAKVRHPFWLPAIPYHPPYLRIDPLLKLRNNTCSWMWEGVLEPLDSAKLFMSYGEAYSLHSKYMKLLSPQREGISCPMTLPSDNIPETWLAQLRGVCLFCARSTFDTKAMKLSSLGPARNQIYFWFSDWTGYTLVPRRIGQLYFLACRHHTGPWKSDLFLKILQYRVHSYRPCHRIVR